MAAHNERRHPAKRARSCATRNPRLRGYSPLRTPKGWSKKQKAKTCRSAARFLTLFDSSPIDPFGANTLQWNCSQFLFFVALFWQFVGADSISARGVLRQRKIPRANTVRPYSPRMVTRRGRRPRRPGKCAYIAGGYRIRPYGKKILAPEGSIGEGFKSVKKNAALLRFLAFLLLDLLFGVPRGRAP